MRSAEVARMAGVSVRTLRHYHALGLVSEPSREANGYRDYDLLDVAQVLRIRRLSSLGFTLAQIGDMLEGSDPKAEDEALDALDRELELRIGELRAQRRVISQLRAERLDPTLPVRFARVLKQLYGDDLLGYGYGPNDSDQERAAMVVAAQLYTEDDIAELERFAHRASEIGAIEPLRALERRIGALAPDASEEERSAIVDEAMRLLDPLLSCLDPANWEEEEEGGVWGLFDSFLDSTQNPAQLDVNHRIEEAMVLAIRMRS